MFFSEAFKGGSSDPPLFHSDTENKMKMCDIGAIYNEKHVGVTISKRFATETELEKMLTVFNSNFRKFYPLQFGNATRWDLSEDDFQRNPSLEQGRKIFQEICLLASAITTTNPVYQEKYSVMFYPKDSSGIGPHRDSKHSVNCIVILVISGNNSFFVAHDKLCKDYIEFETSPGDSIILRGPRSAEDLLSRPIHYVEAITEPRFVMICRHINLDGLQR